MIFLLASIACSTAIYALFKLFGRFGIDTFQAIVFNYYVAAAFGIWYAGSLNDTMEAVTDAPWLLWALLIGALFISLFYVMSLVSQKFGVTVASIASKMSLVIPVVILIAIDPNEGLGIAKLIGVSMGVLAVILASAKGKVKQTAGASMLLPIILFAGSGGLDFLMAYVQRGYLTTEMTYKHFVPIPFAIAALLGTVTLMVQRSKVWTPDILKNLIAGLVLGLVNYGSIYFVLRVIGSGIMDRSSAIPANNIGIVLLSAVVGFFIFKERLSAKNLAGVLLAIVSIILLTYHSF